MSKKIKLIFNILIVIAALAFFMALVLLFEAFQYAAEHAKADSSETDRSIFEYELRHGAYGEIVEDYHFLRRKNSPPAEGYEYIYTTGDCLHSAFMANVYAAKGDTDRAEACTAHSEEVRPTDILPAIPDCLLDQQPE